MAAITPMHHYMQTGPCRRLAALATSLCILGSAILTSITGTLSVLFVISASLLPSDVVLAQNTGSDVNPPVIELESIKQGVAGQDQVFTALVADNGNLLDVKLYHRFSGQQAYQSLMMEPLASTNYYIATVTTAADERRSLEYYVQARDVAGNRIVEGFAYKPLLRELVAPDNYLPDQAGNTAQPGTGDATEVAESGGIKVWQIVLGVVAVGALAGLAASSGGGGGSGEQTVPLTITINAP